MKISILLFAVSALASCSTPSGIQVEMVNARLVKIDTVRRYDDEHSRQLLTWKDDRNCEYISYEPLAFNFSVGTRAVFLRRR